MKKNYRNSHDIAHQLGRRVTGLGWRAVEIVGSVWPVRESLRHFFDPRTVMWKATQFFYQVFGKLLNAYVRAYQTTHNRTDRIAVAA